MDKSGGMDPPPAGMNPPPPYMAGPPPPQAGNSDHMLDPSPALNIDVSAVSYSDSDVYVDRGPTRPRLRFRLGNSNRMLDPSPALNIDVSAVSYSDSDVDVDRGPTRPRLRFRFKGIPIACSIPVLL
ncbi:hypothetical protein EVAR_70664_1 [Eumeta japonica]|uniref:Uncharacterized protein n=1 Tax=Eumeta variegata TaxID=151549 RepID=A0A4C1SGA6_EUMVA|nr:hypothetical protein EVAR_70664_1 [Eumeta japonica]